jgi:hypothetical protein
MRQIYFLKFQLHFQPVIARVMIAILIRIKVRKSPLMIAIKKIKLRKSSVTIAILFKIITKKFLWIIAIIIKIIIQK